ncbi:YceI family protein [Adhaeribacter aquaticus]|uniref:YceI family protein n=1 Tax=Adhaeribacter aquaticus TaxID=299567 RepID=UPI0004069DD8|nr:YceI family protein [Adhaeribacter aquaticus]
MKKLVLSSLVVASLLVADVTTTFANTNGPAPKVGKTVKVAANTYKVDVNQSNMAWEGKKVTGQHNGTIKLANGALQVDKNKVVGGTVEIDMNSIVNLDLTDKEYNGKLIGHLKSDDFFSVEKHPRATFKITNVTPVKGAKAGAANYNVNGILTIKGISNPVTFPATVAVNGNSLTAKSEAVVLDRTKWDIRYGSKSFFANIGDKAINDDFTVQFNLVANNQVGL